MYYKLSNSVNLNVIESEMDVNFRFPDLYDALPIIDGHNEELMPIITNANINQIDFGIWGILPPNFKEDWSVFQNIRNTLNVDIRTIDSDSDYQDVLDKRRCVVVVSGFFASYNFRGQIYPVYVYPKASKVFCLAAIYNTTHDGFLTFTVLLEKSNFEMSKLHNISDSMPIILDNTHKDIWLGEHYINIIRGQNDSYEALDFSSHTIAKEFYKNNIVYDSVLEPAIYKELIST